MVNQNRKLFKTKWQKQDGYWMKKGLQSWVLSGAEQVSLASESKAILLPSNLQRICKPFLTWLPRMQKKVLKATVTSSHHRELILRPWNNNGFRREKKKGGGDQMLSPLLITELLLLSHATKPTFLNCRPWSHRQSCNWLENPDNSKAF